MGSSIENAPQQSAGVAQRTRALRLTIVMTVALGALVWLPSRVANVQAQAAATTDTVTFTVNTARDSLDPAGPSQGDPVTEWKYLINVDNTGDPFGDPAACEADDTGAFPDGWPADCTWPSMQSFTAGAPIYTQGDQSDFAAGGAFASGLDLPDGKYLISVTADGHKIGGAHFQIPIEGTGTATVPVLLDPYPLELVTLRARVFDDVTTNGQVDLPAESPDNGESMAGFTATINDWAAEVTTDWYGNPLCTEYVTDINGLIVLTDGEPEPIAGTGGKCISDDNGDIVIPNLGPNRYAMTIAPPAGTDWVQTTTLEGGLDWDIWAMEGYTGFDTEFNVGGESVPWVLFGYVHPRASAADPSAPAYFSDPAIPGDNTIKGVVGHYDAYTPGAGQPPNTGTVWGGFSGGKITGPIEEPYIALLDLQDGDRAVWVGRGDADGRFQIDGVRDGEYQLTIWDKDIANLLDLFQVTVSGGEIVDTGVLGLTGWFATYNGHVFLDYNENGRRDPNEPGVPDFFVGLRNRENNALELGQVGATTTPDGQYEFDVAYPFTMWTVMEAYSDRYTTTGVTYQASNQATETTVRGSGVDINVLPIIGQSARVDWGVRPYRRDGVDNGGIAGTVFWDTTRNELDPRLAAVEDWAPGLPNVPISVYKAKLVGGNWVKDGPALDSITTEQWERPGPCVARDADGAEIADQLVMPKYLDPAWADGACIEGPLTGIQIDPMSDGAGEFGASVNGNYGFGDLTPGKYIVEVDIPNDAEGRPMYKVEDESSVNVFAGDVYTPQGRSGAASAGGEFADNSMTPGAVPVDDPATQAPGAAAVCVGKPRTATITLDTNPATDNPAFLDAGGTPYRNQTRAGCEAKLIEVLPGRSVAPSFTLYTDVPLPARMWGYTVDDLNIDTDPRRATFGEKAAISHSPTGVYDWSGKLVTVANADPNGIWEVLLPSTTTMNCPSPSGVCPNMYRFVGNDPGPPGSPFPSYNPNYRTIAAVFQAWPGATTAADTAPTQVGASILGPGGTFDALAVCNADPAVPQFFAIDRPYVKVGTGTSSLDRVVRITGDHLGTTPGTVRLLNPDTDAVITPLDVGTWNERVITASLPDSFTTRGAYQLEIVTAAGRRVVNTTTLYVLPRYVGGDSLFDLGFFGTGGYKRYVLQVGPGQQFANVQDAVDASTLLSSLPSIFRSRSLVVVNPQPGSATNPDGAYYENLIVPNAVEIQGVGPGGQYLDGTSVPGAVLHGGNFWAAGLDPNDPNAFLEPIADAWYTRVNNLTWVGNQNVADGEVVYVLAAEGNNDNQRRNTFTSSKIGRIDGLKIMGGDQRDFPGNIAEIGGGQNGQPRNATTQGGGVFLNGYARNFRITNNVLQNNGGAYGGAIRVGTPFAGNNENDGVVIAHNRVLSNGGTQLAGAISIFNGADGYRISDNDICGNSSTEYGGGISHFGLSSGGKILRNRIALNSAYDEGGGVTIAGELPANPSQLSPGAGAVEVRSNVITSNLANDDGGGLRFLQAGNFPFVVENNVIANNVSTHQGGGVALNDAPDVRIVNNTIAANITTATALTSDGLPAPAGLSTTGNSAQLQATLPMGSDGFSNPVLVDNIFRDNRAGTWAGVAGVLGIGNDAGPVNLWDVGNSDGSSGDPTASFSMVDTLTGLVDGGDNIVNQDPVFVDPQTTKVEIYTWRGYQRFRSSAIVSYATGVRPLGDYHIKASSPAIDAGTVGAADDIDGEARPTGNGYDIGADERPGVVVYGPRTAVLDGFQRGTGNQNININLGLNPPWWIGQTANANVRIEGYSGDRILRLRQPSAQFWAEELTSDAQEAYVTFDSLPAFSSSVGVVLRATGLNPNNGRIRAQTSYTEVAYAPYLGGVVVRTKSRGSNPTIRVIYETGFQAGDSLLARFNTDGDLEVYRKPGASDWVQLGVVDLAVGSNGWPTAGTPAGGRIGLNSTLSVGAGRLDDFGGGNV